MEESLLHLHRHRAPITATQPMDLLFTDIRATRSRAMDSQATQDSPLPSAPRPMDTEVIRVSPVTLRIPVLRAMGTRAVRCILPIPVPDIPWLAIPAVALRKSGLLGPSTLLSLLAEFQSIRSSGAGLTAVSAL